MAHPRKKLTTNNYINQMDTEEAEAVKRAWFSEDKKYTYTAIATEFVKIKNAKAGIKILQKASEILGEMWV
jgi:hypothetical protein